MKMTLNQNQPLTKWLNVAFVLLVMFNFGQSQSYWQQEVAYDMYIDFDHNTHQFDGTQKIEYTNNSPETLDKVYYHLYFNAFQPGSMMDVRSRTIADPNAKVMDRIYYLDEKEVGYHQIKSLRQDGKKVEFEVEGTILEVTLNTPIIPGTKTLLEMEFKSQVPLQVRRSGRDNKEGIEYSMSQWYPKLCEYDVKGWHANPYVGGEFHGVWGNFDVVINMDKRFTIGGSGLIQSIKDSEDGKQKWHFRAENVHDFAWGADKDYTHVVHENYDGTIFNYYYQKNELTEDNWAKLPEIMDIAHKYINSLCGEYPYPQYSIIQGGDGGMEYPMATLITGERTLGSLISVCVHELLHSWYQMVLGTNESLYHWMDEGFTVYFQAKTLNHLKEKGYLSAPLENPHLEDSHKYLSHARTGREEPMNTHADHFGLNTSYQRAAYTKGSLFLDQLEYIIGEEAFKKGILEYFNKWKFKHPTPNDFIRIMEIESGLELDWYLEYFVNTTKQIDYSIHSVERGEGKKTNVILEKIGQMPMPLDVVVTKKNGKQEVYYIPLRIMRGEKETTRYKKINLALDWPWTHPGYFLEIECPMDEIEKIEIDPSMRLVDIDRSNNEYIIE